MDVCASSTVLLVRGEDASQKKMLHEATVAVMAGDSLMRKRSRGKRGRLTGYTAAARPDSARARIQYGTDRQ